MPKKKIVIVDDEEDIRHLVELTLKELNYDIYMAGDGLAGKELIEKVDPDLVLLDLKMPKLNGYELTLLLKQDPRFKDLPIIILTSLTEGSSRPDEQWRDSLEVADFISKPCDTQDLLNRVKRVVEAK